MALRHVVVDGSNIATEGRESPSLGQLDEAVRAFAEQYSPDIVTVVVDATFPNRIGRKERKVYEDAVAAGELITPPAGAIGRGDAFVLQIADRADAAILSNDSFQEFHGRYHWLFEEGRLFGGKPVPHVGWVFMERAPVRGPTSRRAVSDARKVTKKRSGEAAPEDAVAPASRARAATAAKAAPKVSSPTAPERRGRVTAPPDNGRAAPSRTAGGPRYNEPLPFIEFIADHPVGSEIEATVERFSSHGAYVLSGPARAYVPLRNLANPPPRSARSVLSIGESRTFVVASIDPPRRGIDLAIPGVVPVPSPSRAVERAGARKPPSTDQEDLMAPAKKKATARKAATRKKAPAKKKAAAKKTTGKKAPARKATARKSTARKTTARKSTAKKATGRKSTAKKATARKSTAKKAPARKSAARKTTARKTTARKTTARKSTAKTAAGRAR